MAAIKSDESATKVVGAAAAIVAVFTAYQGLVVLTTIKRAENKATLRRCILERNL